MPTTTTEQNHAQQNAAAHVETIAALYAIREWADTDEPASELPWEARRMLRELTDRGDDLSPCGDDRSGLRERVETEAREQALSVETRGPWLSLGETAEGPDEWRILLSTGGPALRLCGEFDRWGNASNPVLQWQDWGTPWTDHPTTSGEDEALSWFASLLVWAES